MTIDVGSHVGPYEVLARLGKGGMANLYLGRRSGPAGFSKMVAIKVVHQSLARNQQFVNMFKDEARLSILLSHPNVVHVDRLDEAEGQLYLVMEHIDGVTMADVLEGLVKQQEMLDVATAVAIAAQVADGLHGAHECTDDSGQLLGVVHRDVSPQNVLLTALGHVKLIDFGVAKARGRLQTSFAGSLRGKLSYMAPEQLEGKAVDRRTDVFALAVMLWEMLTLRRLFWSKKETDTMRRVRNAEVTPPRHYRPEIPEEVEAVILGALAKDPEDRPQSAYGLRKALLLALPEALMVEPKKVSALVHGPARERLEARRAWMNDITDASDDATLVNEAAPGASEPRAEWMLYMTPPPLPELEAELAVAREGAAEDPNALGRALGRYAMGLLEEDRLDEARKVMAEAVTIATQLSEWPQLAAAVPVWQARLAEARGDLSEALVALRSAVDLLEQSGQSPRALRAGVHLGHLWHRLGQYENAERTLRSHLPRTRQIDHKALEAEALLRLGEAVAARGRPDEARTFLEEALHISRPLIESPVGLHTRVELARLDLARERYPQAIKASERAAKKAMNRRRPRLSAVAWAVAATAHLAKEDLEAATRCAESAFEAREASGRPPNEDAWLHLACSQVFALVGDRTRAKALLEAGKAALQERAAAISDEGLRASFLEKGPGARRPAILAVARATSRTSPGSRSAPRSGRSRTSARR